MTDITEGSRCRFIKQAAALAGSVAATSLAPWLSGPAHGDAGKPEDRSHHRLHPAHRLRQRGHGQRAGPVQEIWPQCHRLQGSELGCADSQHLLFGFHHISKLDWNSSLALAATLEGFAQSMFTRYYENQLDSIKAKHGERKNWPSVLQFAAVVRDAMSHGGIIHMFPLVATVAHFNLSYSHADNGRKSSMKIMTCADIFYLMLEMDAAF